MKKLSPKPLSHKISMLTIAPPSLVMWKCPIFSAQQSMLCFRLRLVAALHQFQSESFTEILDENVVWVSS